MRFGIKHVAALDFRFDSSAGKNLSIRDYFHTLLHTLYAEGEGFSGKRPFGDSGWQEELCQVLVKNEIIEGSFDEDGYADFDQDIADEFIFAMIDAAFYGK